MKTATLSEYQTKEFESAEKLAATISEFYPAEAIARYSEYDGGKHFEGADVFLIHPTLKIRVQFSSRDKQYRFYNQSERDLKNMTYNSIGHIRKNFEEPQGVGVLSTKKINTWVSYHERVFKALSEQNDLYASQIHAFRESIKDLPVKWYGQDKNKTGEIIRNGIKFSFEIMETFVSTRTEIYHTYDGTNGLTIFLQLSDNKYIQPKED